MEGVGASAARTGLREKNVVVTRDEAPDGPLCTCLRARGANPILRSGMTFRFEGLDSPLAEAVRDWEEWDWLALTSARAVRALAGVRAFDARQPMTLRVAAIGPGTAAAVRAQGWSVELAPDTGGAAVLAEVLRPHLKPGRRLLLPLSEVARNELETSLRPTGAEIRRVTAYAPVPRRQDSRLWREDLEADRYDALTFTSPSAIDALRVSLAEGLFDRILEVPAGVQGPTTALAAREAGWSTVIEAQRTTFDGLAEQLDHWFLSA